MDIGQQMDDQKESGDKPPDSINHSLTWGSLDEILSFTEDGHLDCVSDFIFEITSVLFRLAYKVRVGTRVDGPTCR